MGVTQQERSQQTTPAPRGLGLSVGQVVGSAAAAASAAVVASFFGVAGTVIGAAVVSVVATVTTALYRRWVDRTTEVVLSTTVRRRADGTVTRTREVVQEEPRPRRQLPWRRVLLGAASIFVLALAVITVVELVSGRPISALLGQNGDRGTSIQHVVRPGPAPARTATPTPAATTRSATPSTSPTSTSASPSSPTVSTRPTGTPSATPSSPLRSRPPTSPAPQPSRTTGAPSPTGSP